MRFSYYGNTDYGNKTAEKRDISFGKSLHNMKKPTANYSVGQRVKHSTFGEGMVISVTPMGADNLLEIAFDSVGTKKLMSNYAKLTII